MVKKKIFFKNSIINHTHCRHLLCSTCLVWPHFRFTLQNRSRRLTHSSSHGDHCDHRLKGWWWLRDRRRPLQRCGWGILRRCTRRPSTQCDPWYEWWRCLWWPIASHISLFASCTCPHWKMEWRNVWDRVLNFPFFYGVESVKCDLSAPYDISASRSPPFAALLPSFPVFLPLIQPP